MKKYCILLLFLIISLNGFSQGMSFTVFAEPQISWFSPDSKNLEAGGSMIGFNGGLNYDQYFAEKYAFSTGISINNINGKLKYQEADIIKGLNADYNINPGDIVEYHLQYINVPIGLKFKTIEIGYTRFFAHLGMDADINIKTKANIPGEDNINAIDELNWYNLGYYIGGGIEYSLGGSTAIVAGLTYKNGFLDITKDNDQKVTTGTMSLRLGILF
jgi:hypothetical protein